MHETWANLFPNFRSAQHKERHTASEDDGNLFGVYQYVIADLRTSLGRTRTKKMYRYIYELHQYVAEDSIHAPYK